MATGGMNAEPNLESFELQARDKDAQIISSMPVEQGDINKLAEQLNDVAGIWDLFVGLLGVPRSKQQQIARNNTNHPAFAQICLVDGLQYWVESDPSPTIEKVIAALSSRTINNKQLAAEIARKWGVQVQSNVQAAAVALNPQVKWEGYQVQGEKHYGVLGDRDVLLIASEARLPEAVSHTPPPQLSEDERAGYLTSQGVPPDCPLDDLHIMRARYKLDERCEIVGVVQSTLEHPLTTSYVKSKIKELFQKCKKAGVLLYYHGPGRKGTGDWCFADGFITFQDIADLYIKYFVVSVLVIHTDCSYSGSWVKSCGEFLDKKGVQPCGHSAREKGILIKVFASSKATEAAQSLYYSTRVARNKTNSGELCVALSVADDLQYCTQINSTHIRCDNETIEQPCTLPPDFTWQKQLANDEARKRVFINRGIYNGQRVWHYLLLVDDRETIRLYKDKTQGANAGKLELKVEDYGKVLAFGRGEPPLKQDQDKWLDKLNFTVIM